MRLVVSGFFYVLNHSSWSEYTPWEVILVWTWYVVELFDFESDSPVVNNRGVILIFLCQNWLVYSLPGTRNSPVYSRPGIVYSVLSYFKCLPWSLKEQSFKKWTMGDYFYSLVRSLWLKILLISILSDRFLVVNTLGSHF